LRDHAGQHGQRERTDRPHRLLIEFGSISCSNVAGRARVSCAAEKYGRISGACCRWTEDLELATHKLPVRLEVRDHPRPGRLETLQWGGLQVDVRGQRLAELVPQSSVAWMSAAFISASLVPKWYPIEPRFVLDAATMSRAVVRPNPFSSRHFFAPPGVAPMSHQPSHLQNIPGRVSGA